MNKIKITLLSIFVLLTSFVSAQIVAPVTIEIQTKEISSTDALIVFKATIEKGWHMYSIDEIEYGPNPTKIKIDKISGASLNGTLKPQTTPIKKYDEMFQAEVSYFENSAVFIQKLKLHDKKYSVTGCFEYSACNDQSCIPPSRKEFDINKENECVDMPDNTEEVKIQQTADENLITINDSIGFVEMTDTVEQDSVGIAKVDDTIPFIKETNSSSNDMIHIFLMGLLGGFIALLTPCVWPIIPMTVSFFIKRAKKKTNAISDAVIYGLSIIIIYLVLGLAVTLIFGANALNSMSTNAWFNIFFFMLLVIFALSFFGLFELQLPASWSTKIDNKAERTNGLFGIFLMAFTLTIVSFSCTGPIIGFLLVEVASLGNLLGPAVGMFGFSLGLAIPFALFSMFPNWLNKMPRSGTWMNTLKVILGFVELFFSLKFLSVADLAYGWHILDRDVFIALWILFAIALGAYLIGLYHFSNETNSPKIGWFRYVLGALVFSFAVWMVPGLWGEPLKAISAFTPPMSTQHWRRVKIDVLPRTYDYDEGVRIAKKEHKPIIIDFTGYGCVNCRKMESVIWTDPEAARFLQEEYVLVQLFVDDKTSLFDIIEINEGGQVRKLRTVGDKWSYLQSSRFGANAQPFYVLLNPYTEKLLTEPYGFDENADHYIQFLKVGLKQMKQYKK